MFHRLSPQLALRSRWRPYWARPGERVLVLRTSRVFPPGHPTTRLSLTFLQEAMAERPCRRLLDLGCGSGVLMLTGAALGAEFCLGVDLWGPAVRLSRENLRENGLDGAAHLVQGSSECLRGTFDLVVANLPWAVQLELVAELERLAAPAGVLILSGFRDVQEAELLARHQALGWRLTRRLSRDEWAIEVPPEGSYTWVGWRLNKE
jgi:ribosomal protein L11 methyltransferase